MRIKVKKIAAIGAALTMALSMATSAAAQNIKLGMTMPTKTLLGKQAVQAAELAVEMINAKGGILNGRKIELVVYDDGNSPVEGVAASQRLLDRDKVKVIMGQISSTVALAVLPLAKVEDVIFMPIIPKHNGVTATGYDKVFRLNSTVAMDGAVFNDYVATQINPTKITFIGENSDFGRLLETSLSTAFGKSKMGFVGFYDLKQADFNSLVTDARSSGADTLVVGGAIVEQYANLVRAAREIGFRPRATVMGAGTLNRRFVELAGPASEGAVSVDIYVPTLDTPLNRDFVTRYKAKFGVDPEKIEALAFEAPWIIAQAMERAGTATDTKRIADVLHSNSWEAPRGTVTFDKTGQALSKSFVVHVKDGQILRN